MAPSGTFWLGRLACEDEVRKGTGDDRSERLDPCAIGIRFRPAEAPPWSMTVTVRARAWVKDPKDGPDPDRRWWRTGPVEEKIPVVVGAALGYELVHHGPGQWNGVAIVSRIGISDVVAGIPTPDGWTDDGGRFLAASCGPIRVASIYVPNGRTVDSEFYLEKLEWLARLARWLDDNDPATELAICGDYNVAPEDSDVWDINAVHGATHVSPRERAAVARLREWGMVDVVRRFHPEPDYFTEDQLKLVTAASAQIATAVNKAELYRLIADQAERLGVMYRIQAAESAKNQAILAGITDGVLVLDAQRAGGPHVGAQCLDEQPVALPDLIEITGVDAWDRVQDINLKSVFFSCQAGARLMLKTGGGKIVAISEAERREWAQALPNLAQEWAAAAEKQGLPGKAYLKGMMDGLRAGVDHPGAALGGLRPGRDESPLQRAQLPNRPRVVRVTATSPAWMTFAGRFGESQRVLVELRSSQLRAGLNRRVERSACRRAIDPGDAAF